MLSKMISLLIFVHLSAQIWAIVQVYRSREGSSTKILWAVLILVPVLGLIIWYFAGPRSQRGRRRSLRNACLVMAPFVFACGEFSLTPQQVTEQFWEALRAGEVEAAKAHASVSSSALVNDLDAERRIEDVLLGEALLGERSAIVRTSLATSLGGHRLHTTFDTHLVREAEAWRVDVEATRRALTTALFASSLQQIGEAVGEGAQVFSEALEEGASEINRAIREALQELERELQQPAPPY